MSSSRKIIYAKSGRHFVLNWPWSTVLIGIWKTSNSIFFRGVSLGAKVLISSS